MKLGFIGAGNMGGALIEACAKTISGNEIGVSDMNSERCTLFASKYGTKTMTAAECASSAEYLFIGVKPQAAQSLFDSIKSDIAKRENRPIIVTMMAGKSIDFVRGLIGDDAIPVIRIMPNVAASVGEAMILVSSDGVSEDSLNEFKAIMAKSGKLADIPEKLIDAGSAVSGCGPAYVCLFIEALSDGAVKCGIPRKTATELAIQTVLGTAKLLEETGKHPAVVKDEVTSPAGTTIEGICALEEHGFRSAVIDAVVESWLKNSRL